MCRHCEKMLPSLVVVVVCILLGPGVDQTRFVVKAQSPGDDLNPPTHCLLQATDNARNCSCFPIRLDQDIRTNADVEPELCGWTDDASGIDRYHVEVYFMNVGGTGQLEETGRPLYTEDIRPPRNRFRLRCETSGVYSIQLTVYDRANNSARARQLFNYDGVSKMTINEDKPIYVAEADQSTGRRWINHLPNPRNSDFYNLTLIWKGRYRSDNPYADECRKAAKPWTPGDVPCTRSSNCIDDDSENNKYGVRTVRELRTLSGIVGYGVAWVRDRYGGVGLTQHPAYKVLPPRQDQFSIPVRKYHIYNGDVVVIWFTVSDMAGNRDDEKLIVGLDRTAPDVTSDVFNIMTVNEFTSTLELTTHDEESGIESVSCTIYDATLRFNVWTTTHSGQQVPRVHTDPIRPEEPDETPDTHGSPEREERAAVRECPAEGDPTCYCIPKGDCFARVQKIDIDHCNFDRHTNNQLQIIWNVTNQAGLSSTGTIEPEDLTGIHCRPVLGLSYLIWAGIAIAVLIPTLVAFALCVVMLWRWRHHKDPLPQPARNAFNRTFRRHTQHTRRERERETRREVDINKTTTDGARNNNELNLLRKVDSMEEEYVAVDNITGVKKVTSSQIQKQKTLVTGRFAVVHSGTLKSGSESKPVAIKSLKRTSDSKDRQLMLEKITFMAAIPENANIVKFIASCNDIHEGPMMLMELCDMTLKDWLNENSSLTVAMLDDILVFALNIASGVEFLHSKHIVHRRLGLRNVLLCNSFSGFVAKLIGFGPTNEDSDASDMLPLRWMAPETLESISWKTLAYNNKTDVWTFGITVWEMYSKGAKPYPKLKHDEVKSWLMKGGRMDCPTDCPPQLFETVVKPCWDSTPERRPEFDVIRANIDKFHRGDSSGGEDYYSQDEVTRAPETYKRP